MIITRLTGGLGNQLFQYAAGFALARRHRTALKLDARWFNDITGWAPHNQYALDSFALPAHLATEAEIRQACGPNLTRSKRWAVSLARTLGLRQWIKRWIPSTQIYRPAQFAYDSTFETLTNETYLDGLFQSERYFENEDEELKRQFTPRLPLSSAAQRIKSAIQAGPAAFVHVRRGDYASSTRFRQEFGLVGSEYYQRALSLLRTESSGVRFFVFSDEPASIAPLFAGQPDVVIADPEKTLSTVETLEVMRSCEHAIIANSTFSWWGAWLIRHAGKKVIAPHPWFRESTLDTRDVVPRAWTRLDAAFVK